MSAKLLQITYSFAMSPAEYKDAVTPFADVLARVPGQHWKIWLIDEQRREAGGTYLFDDDKAVRAYLESPIVSQEVINNPAFSNLSVKQFDILEDPTAVTRGPVGAFAQR